MADIMKYIVDDTLINTDPNGYLLDLEDWTEAIAESLASDEDIEMTPGHWQVVNFLREHYIEYGTSPNVRLLMKVLTKQFGPEVGNRKHLYTLFPNGPSRQGCKIAGLPLPNDCVDWFG